MMLFKRNLIRISPLEISLRRLRHEFKGGVVDKIKFDYAMRTMQDSSQPVREALGENIRKAVAENRYSDK